MEFEQVIFYAGKGTVCHIRETSKDHYELVVVSGDKVYKKNYSFLGAILNFENGSVVFGVSDEIVFDQLRKIDRRDKAFKFCQGVL